MTEAFPHFHIVLLCDSFGSGLWPIAREDAPACLAPVEPGSGTSLLAAAVARVGALSEHALHIVTTQQLAPLMEEELLTCPELEKRDIDMLVMPSERGSAFAVALMTARIRRQDPSAVVAVFPSNQQVEFDDRWERLMYRAYMAALQDKVVLIGGQQGEKCADNTYIRRGRVFNGLEDTYEVSLFNADKPAIVAQRARREGALWYTGVFFGRAAVIMGEFARAGQVGRTDEAHSCGRIAETAMFFAELGVSDLLKPEAAEVVDAMPNVTFDKAVLEVSENVVVVPTTVRFSTVNTLPDLEKTIEPDAAYNRVLGNAAVLNSRNTTIYAQDGARKVMTLGMRDCMVIDTGDVLLVVHKDQLGNLGDALSKLG